VFFSQEEKAAKTVSTALIRGLKFEADRSGLDFSSTKIVILEGFLLFHNPDIRKRLDLSYS
jgi:uridine kinase